MQSIYEAGFVDRRTKVWLECTGEPFDYRSVSVRHVTRTEVDVELVTFSCPRCGGLHESLRFY
jgi:hypothetical protein